MKEISRVLAQPLVVALVCLAPVLLYQSLYTNAFYPITEGWFSTFGWLIGRGAVPYRDFPLLLPPLYPVLIAGFQAVFGTALLPLHVLGVLITGMLGLSLFQLLRSLFPVWAAGVSAAIALLYYQSGNAFIGYDFTQVVTLFMLVGTALLLEWIRTAEGVHPFSARLYLLAAGASFGCALLTKHSNAIMVIAAMGLAMSFTTFRMQGIRGLRTLGWLLLGGAIPLAGAAAGLIAFGALDSFFQNVIVDASGAKGGVKAALVNWMQGFFAWESFRTGSMRLASLLAPWLAAGLALLVVCIGWRRWRPVQRREGNVAALLGLAGAVLMTALVLVIYLRSCGRCTGTQFLGVQVAGQAVLWSVLLYAIGGVGALLAFLWKPNRIAAAALLLLWLGLGLIAGNGTSAGLSEISAFLGVALFAAAWLAFAGGMVLPTLVPAVLLVSFAAYLIEHKFRDPYYWWAIESPDIRQVQCARVDGVLRGLCVPPGKAQGIAAIEALVRLHSRPDEPIYVFPHMPVFHLLTGRPPFAGAVVSWFDFMSDRQALAIADALRTAPPAVLVVAQMPENVFSAHEQLFRAGKRMGQRDITAAIDELRSQGRIREIARLPDLDKLEVVVYARSSVAETADVSPLVNAGSP